MDTPAPYVLFETDRRDRDDGRALFFSHPSAVLRRDTGGDPREFFDAIEAEVAAGRFREDLFYRLCVVPIVVPPLRERIEDVSLLVDHFLNKESVASGGRRGNVSDEVMLLLTSYNWPGNVRELQNALQFAWIKCKGAEIEPAHLPINLRHVVEIRRAVGTRRKKLTVEAVTEALAKTRGNKSEAAKLLGVSRATLYRFLEDISGVFFMK